MTTLPHPDCSLAHLPLLLPRRGVLEWLPEFNRRTLIEYCRDGDLRQFHPDPTTRGTYYFAADVARIGGRPFEIGWIDALPGELVPEAFAQHSGLAPWALYLALRHGVLAHRRTAIGVRVLTSELRKFF